MTEPVNQPTPTDGDAVIDTTAAGVTGTGAATAAATGGQPDAQPAASATEAPKEGDGTKTEGAPESYEFTAPEGMTFDAGVVEAFSDVARELDLPQDKAQTIMERMAPVIRDQQAAQAAALSEQWADEVRNDPEIGGDKLNESQVLVRKAMSLAPPEVKQFLNDSPLGNHPGLFKWAMAVGRALSDDRFVSGDSSAGALSAGDRAYQYAEKPASRVG